MENLNFDQLWQRGTPFGEQNVEAPVSPISPLSKNASNSEVKDYTFDQALNNALSDFEQSVNKPLSNKGAIQSSPELSDNFRYQDDYTGVLNPADYQGNIKRAQALEDWGNVISKSFDDLGYKFTHSYLEYWYSYGRLGEAILKADMSHLDPDEGSLIEKYYQDQLNEKENYIFQTDEEEQDFFNKQFFKDVVGNTGFTLGTFAGVGTELAFDMVLAGLTGGASVPAQVSSKVVRYGNILQDFAKGLKMADRTVDEIKALKSLKATDKAQLRQMSAVTDGFSTRAAETMRDHLKAFGFDYRSIAKSKTLHEKFITTLEQIPVAGTLLQTGRKAANAQGLSKSTTAGMTFQGFRRSMAEFNLASSEAAFEAVSTYGSTLDQMHSKFLADNNRAPTAMELEEMKNYSMLAAGSNYNTNTAILLLSNKLTFGNIFTRFGPIGKTVDDLLEAGSDRVIKVGAKNAAGYFVRRNSYRALIDASKVIGKKEAFKEMLKTFGRSTLTRFSLVEGFQENLQETSNFAWQDYYTRMYSRDPADILHSVQEGMADQFTEQGLKTFLIGAFTGVLTQPVIIGSQRGVQQLENFAYRGESPYTQYRNQQNADIDIMNTFIGGKNEENAAKIFSDKILNFNIQQDIAEGMEEAIYNKNEYEFNNLRATSLFTAIKSAINTNSIDAFTFEIRRIGEAYGMEEGITDPVELQKKINNNFKEAFGIDLSMTKYKTPKALADSIANDIEKYAKTLEDVKTKLPKPTPFDMYPEGSVDRWIQAVHYQALRDAAEVIALNEIRSDDAKGRSQSIISDLSTTPGLSNVSSYLSRVLVNGAATEAEMGLIESEIKMQEQTLEDLTGDSRREAKETLDLKKEELRLLKQWYSVFMGSPVLDRKNADMISYSKSIIRENFQNNEEQYEKRRKLIMEKRKEFHDNLVANGISSEEAYEFIEKHFPDLKKYNSFKQEMKSALKDLIDIKNKQSGINIKFRSSLTNQTFQRLMDLSNLDADVVDFMEAADALSNPETFKKMVYRMAEGRTRAGIISFINYITDKYSTMMDVQAGSEAEVKRIQSEIDVLIESDDFKELERMILTDESIIPKYDRSQKLVKAIESKFNQITGSEKKTEVTKPEEADPVTDKPVKEVPTGDDEENEEVPTKTDTLEEKKQEGNSRPVTIADLKFNASTGTFVYEEGDKAIDISIVDYEKKSTGFITTIEVYGTIYDKNKKERIAVPETGNVKVIVTPPEGTFERLGDNGLLAEAVTNPDPKLKTLIDNVIEALDFDPIVDDVDADEVINDTLNNDKKPTKEEKVVKEQIEEKKPESAEPVVEEEEKPSISGEDPADILARARAAREKPVEATVEEIEEAQVVLDSFISDVVSKMKPPMSKRISLKTKLSEILTKEFKNLKQPMNQVNMKNFLESNTVTEILRNFKGEEEIPVAKTKAKKTSMKKDTDPKPSTPSEEQDGNIISEDDLEKGFNDLEDDNC